MAILVSTTDTAVQTSGTSYSVTIGANQENDLVLVYLSSTATSAFDTPPTNWTALGTSAASQLSRSRWFYRVAPAGGISSPVAFTVPNDVVIGACLVVRYANITPTLEWQRYDWGNSTNISTAISTSVTASSEAANAMITPPDNALLIYAITSDGNPYLRASLNELMQDSQIRQTQISHAIGHRQHGTGTLPAVTFRASLANEGGNMWVISIADDGNGKLERNWFSGGTEYDYRGDYGEVQFPFGTAGAATTIDDAQTAPPATPTLAGIDLSTTAGSIQSQAYAMVNSPNGRGTNLRFSENVAGTPKWQGVVQTLNSNQNMQGKIFAMHYYLVVNDSSLLGSNGFAVAFADAGGDWTAYQLATSSSALLDLERVCFISLGYGTELGSDIDSGQAMNWDDIDKIGFLTHRTGSAVSNTDIGIKNLMLLGTATITGGYAAAPATFQWSKTPSQSWMVFDLQRLQGESQSMINWPLQIGDGATPTYFEATASAYTTPAAYSVASGTSQQDWNVPAGRAGITLYAKASDTMDFSAALLSNSVVQPFGFHASSATSSTATFDFQGCVFVGWDVTWKTDVECEGATFSNCATVKFKGASPINVTIKNCHSDVGATDAACSFDANGATLTTSTIDCTGSSAGYAIELGAAVTAITLADCTITAGSTDKVHVLKTTGTVTITISGTTSLAAGDVTTEGATVTIAGPTINQSVVVSGFTAGSRIQIYDTTNATELFNGTASAGDTVVSGTTATWTDPVAASGSRAIRVRVAYVSGTSAKQFIETSGLTCGVTDGTESVTYPISQVDDETYNNNAIDGPAIYATSGITFTDAATDLVNISIAGGAVTWPTIYACFVYWIFTAAGIDDDVAYIDAPDTANYLLTSMKLKNTHTNPLTVTSGFGRSATTGLVADIIDTAGSTGNIFPTPDHVVAYATGSGALTAGDITNIWSAATRTITTTIPTASQVSQQVLTDAQSTPIHADVRKVTGVTVTGVGTEADPWGP